MRVGELILSLFDLAGTFGVQSRVKKVDLSGRGR